MTVRDALNSAMDEELARDDKVYVLGEEVRTNKYHFREGERKTGPYYTGSCIQKHDHQHLTFFHACKCVLAGG